MLVTAGSNLVTAWGEHCQLMTTVIEMGANSEYFAVAELNIKTWQPCRLYHFDGRALTELYTYDATRIVGLKILNLK